jgi:glutathione S-transferase
MYTLHIGNKNYSSWSLRPWVLLSELGIPFTEKLHVFGPEFTARSVARSPSGKVPVLHDGETVVWDSLAIAEYVAESHPGAWPADAKARAWARSAAAEMHSGFATLRDICTMNCGVRIALSGIPEALQADIARIDQLWNEGIERFGGPFLAGSAFGAVDAFFCPVAFRVQTYGLKLSPRAGIYAKRLLGLPSMRRWYDDALAEQWRDAPHEGDLERHGKVVEDLRVGAGSVANAGA